MPTYRLPFLVLTMVTWLGGVVFGSILVGGPEWAESPSGALVVPPTASSIASGSPSASPSLPTFAPSPTSPVVTARPTARPTKSPTPTPTKPPTPMPTKPPPTIALACANGMDNGGGTGTLCEITIRSDSATILECHGAAGDPRAACTLTVLAGRVVSVDACNGSANGGGATMRCSVTVVGGPRATSVNQCVGSGDGITVGCIPFPATVSNATVNQCNGSANGGTLVGLACIVSGSGGVLVRQCNLSGNGGGGLVVCSVRQRVA